jgi:hypothetical protein
MKTLFLTLCFALAGVSFAEDGKSKKDMCLFQVGSSYPATSKCRVNDVMIGAEIQDGTLKLECGHPIILCNGLDGSASDSSDNKPQSPQVAERWYCTGICYIIGDPEVDPHHKVSAYGPTEAAARAALKCDPDDLSDVVCRQVEKK